jgi:hypothetical protein
LENGDMLEILLLVYLCKNIGQKLRAKARKPLLLQILLILMWFGGEVVGFIVGMVVYTVVYGQEPPEFSLPIYLGAIVGAACGTAFCFMIAWLIPPAYQEPNPAFVDDDGSPMFGAPPADPNNPYSSPQTWNE